jgi:hypothetical protein
MTLDDYRGKLPIFSSFPREGMNLFAHSGREKLLTIFALLREKIVNKEYHVSK